MMDQIYASSYPVVGRSRSKKTPSDLERELTKRAVTGKSSIPKLNTPMPRLKPPVVRHEYGGNKNTRFLKKL